MAMNTALRLPDLKQTWAGKIIKLNGGFSIGEYGPYGESISYLHVTPPGATTTLQSSTIVVESSL